MPFKVTPETPAPPVTPRPTPGDLQGDARKGSPLVKHEYNGLWYAPELKKFVDPETDKPISDHTFEAPTIPGLPGTHPLSPVSYPTEDTVDWIVEAVKGLPDHWYAKKLKAEWAFFSTTYPQWLVEVTKRDGRSLVFAPGLFALLLFKHGEQIALSMLDSEFPKG